MRCGLLRCSVPSRIPCLQHSPAGLLLPGCSCYPAKSQTQPHFASSPDTAPVRSG
ncbi:hypothetical protein PAHAL_5G298100 [Panicum hallii]|uniref:Uncharacterized protein n=1 Tax=Panicum hallii TaxID=206008 RepID=A0A2T8ILP9_9POAL|nr:hypothetical protein PAHAL_5G298100 [Panicum hallii]